MKITKKMRKKLNGMNSATANAFNSGFNPPQFVNGKKTAPGTPYVNPNNFR